MARARNIKPGLYKNEDLAECSIWARYIFPGLWMLADREGRLEDRPKRIKGELLPYDTTDVEPLLAELSARGFIVRYEYFGQRYIQIAKFSEHQAPHVREQASTIPAPPDSTQVTTKVVTNHDQGSDIPSPRSPDSLIPSSLNPSSTQHSVEQAERSAPDPTTVGAIGLRLKAASVVGINLSHPELLKLIDAGATADELGAIAEEPKAIKKFAWIIATAKGRRIDAAESGSIPPARASPRRPTLTETRAATIAGLTSIGTKPQEQRNERDITGESSVIAIGVAR